MKLPVVEIFQSVQGEGCNLGKAANFIRLAGCNLNCPWCDTDWSVPKLGNLDNGEIIDQLNPSIQLVVITGGEPLIHDLNSLILSLFNLGWKVAIETNGTRPACELKERFPDLWITCSPKPEVNWEVNISGIDELKYVVDGALKKENILNCYAAVAGIAVWLQPEGSKMQERWQEALKMQKEVIRDYPSIDVRIGVQLHKIMEVR